MTYTLKLSNDDTGVAIAVPLTEAQLAALTAPPLPTPAPSSSMPVGDLPGWHQIFAEDFLTAVPVGSFPGSVYGKRWTGYGDGVKDTTGHGQYWPSKVLSVHDSVLDWYLHTADGIHMAAAPIPIVPGVTGYGNWPGQTYGRYSVRFRADSLAGYKTAWLLWPDSNVWNDGEIDFPESYNDLTGPICASSHHVGDPSSTEGNFFLSTTGYGAFHIATIEWSPGSVTFILDGTVLGVAKQNIPTVPMHVVAQTESATSGPAPADSVAGHVELDWIVVYAPAST